MTCLGVTGQAPLPPSRSRRRAFSLWLASLLTLFGLAAPSSSSSASAQSAISRSQQFLVHPAKSATGRQLAEIQALDSTTITLTQARITVTCEQIKSALNGALGLGGHAHGKIRIHTFPARSPQDRATVEATFFTDGFQYEVRLPNPIRRQRFLRAMSHAILWEFANRTPGVQSAEIPMWFLEGITRELALRPGLQFAMDVPEVSLTTTAFTGLFAAAPMDSSAVREGRWQNPVETSKAVLRQRPPMTFEQLSFAQADNLTWETLEIYQANAHVFLDALRRLPDGTARLRHWLQLLPTYWNWQTAFYHAFQSDFQGPNDVEKWWAVVVAEIMGRDETNTWTKEVSLAKIQEALHVSVRIGTTSDTLPKPDQVPITRVISEWDYFQTRSALSTALARLQAIRFSVHRELLPVVDVYRAILWDYLAGRAQVAPAFALKNRPESPVNSFNRRTLQQLQEADALLRRSAANVGRSLDR